ncbi:MAG: ModD protein [Wolinella sp.]
MDEIWRIIDEDSSYFDLTTVGLGIGEKHGEICFSARKDGVIAGVVVVLGILKNCNLNVESFVSDGERVIAGRLLVRGVGRAIDLHKAWKVAQNTLEYTSGIATLTDAMISRARAINPHIELLTTRKNFPLTKNLALLGVQSGGGGIHRLGLFDSVLVFAQHRIFLDDERALKEAFARLKRKMIEKRICVEVASVDEARYFANLGADILQCEKMGADELLECVRLKDSYPGLLVSATGGITLENIDKIAKSGVDFIVTSAPYHATPLDIEVKMKQIL